MFSCFLPCAVSNVLLYLGFISLTAEILPGSQTRQTFLYYVPAKTVMLFEACLIQCQDYPRITLNIYLLFWHGVNVTVIWQLFWSPFLYNLSSHQTMSKRIHFLFTCHLLMITFSFWMFATVAQGTLSTLSYFLVFFFRHLFSVTCLTDSELNDKDTEIIRMVPALRLLWSNGKLS